MTARQVRLGPGATRFGVALAVALVTALIFPALAGQFLTWDDNTTLTGNTAFRGFGRAQLHWMVTNTLMGHYMPLTWLSFAVSHAIGGMDPWFYHAGSLLLHALNAGLPTLLAWRLIARALDRPVSATATAGPER